MDTIAKMEKSLDELIKSYTNQVHSYSRHISDTDPSTRIQSAYLWGQLKAYQYLRDHLKHIKTIK